MSARWLLPAVALLVSTPLPARAQPSGPDARIGFAGEVLSSEEEVARDIGIWRVALELEAPLPAGFWVRGAFGPTFTSGTFRRFGRTMEADGGGFGASGWLRWRPAWIGPAAPFLEGGPGVLLTTEAFPPGGTWWNLTYRLGLGLALDLPGSLELSAAWRHFHASNGKDGSFENPAYNGRGFVVFLGW